MIIISSAFGNFEDIPLKHTGEGDDLSPPLRWQDFPEETRSFVLICDDPDAPNQTWDHWILYNIPPHMNVLAEGLNYLPKEIQILKNGWGRKEYGGPMPPTGKHRYFFKLYALNTLIQLPADATKQDLIEAMRNHILAEATLVGCYEKQYKD